MRSLSKALALTPTVALLAAALTACGSTATAIAPSTLPTTVAATTSTQMPTTMPTVTKLPTVVPTKTAAPTAVATMLPTEAATEATDMTGADTASTVDPEATDTTEADAASTVEAQAADAAATMEALTTTMDASAAPSIEGEATADTQAVCTSPLITTAEVEQIVGKLDGAPSAMTDDTTGAASCGYPGASALVSIDSSKGGAAKLQEQVQAMKQHGAPLQPVKGLGEEAYSAVAAMQGVPNKTAVQGVLMARKGQNILVITMLSNVNEAKTTAALRALALKALPRLP